jgi:hypothetical protein
MERDVLDADATVVSLPHLTPNFYELGIHILRLNIRDAEHIGTTLITTFQARYVPLALIPNSMHYATSTRTLAPSVGYMIY